MTDQVTKIEEVSYLYIWLYFMDAMGIGMFLLNFSSPKNFQPFILISVITSAALIPILLTKKNHLLLKK